ncbi:MAG: hypothetical protein ABII90_07720 [Bacteroidota bacterium]
MRRVCIDDIDLNIIHEINSLKGKDDMITTYEISKKLLKYGGPYELKRNDNFIRSRLKKLSEYGLIKINNGGYNSFLLLCSNVEKRNWSVFKIKQCSYFLRIDGRWYVFPFRKISGLSAKKR